ncbi:MAG TPA: hypothetical protein VH877_28275 [Polyangia bacterium]|jgi:hypothetical protein|nr:hypothetical protein [Polyangia bacterium]
MPVQEVLDRYTPHLERCERTIRSSDRGAKYYAIWDAFAAAILRPFNVPPLVPRLVGADLGTGVDSFFERRVGEPRRLMEGYRLLTGAAHPAFAQQVIEGERYRGGPADFDDAVALLIGYLTSAAVEVLADRPDWMDAWSRAWALAMRTQNRQQLSHARLVGQDRPPRSAVGDSFSSAALRYIGLFYATDATSISLIGAMAFSPLIGQLPAPVLRIRRSLSRVVRATDDLRFDAPEPLNACVFGIACERGIPFSEARRQLIADPALVQECQAQMIRLTRHELHLLEETTSQLGDTVAPEIVAGLQETVSVIRRAVQHRIESTERRQET